MHKRNPKMGGEIGSKKGTKSPKATKAPKRMKETVEVGTSAATNVATDIAKTSITEEVTCVMEPTKETDIGALTSTGCGVYDECDVGIHDSCVGNKGCSSLEDVNFMSHQTPHAVEPDPVNTV